VTQTRRAARVPRRRHCLHRLVRSGGREEGLQFKHVLRKAVGILQGPAQRPHGELVGAWRPPKAEVDTAGVKPRQGPELLGDDDRGVVRQHDATRADTDGVGARRDVAHHHRGGGAGDARHVVMLGDPKPAIAPSFGMRGKIASIVERAAGVGILRDADQIEYR